MVTGNPRDNSAGRARRSPPCNALAQRSAGDTQAGSAGGRSARSRAAVQPRPTDDQQLASRILACKCGISAGQIEHALSRLSRPTNRNTGASAGMPTRRAARRAPESGLKRSQSTPEIEPWFSTRISPQGWHRRRSGTALRAAHHEQIGGQPRHQPVQVQQPAHRAADASPRPRPGRCAGAAARGRTTRPASRANALGVIECTRSKRCCRNRRNRASSASRSAAARIAFSSKNDATGQQCGKFWRIIVDDQRNRERTRQRAYVLEAGTSAPSACW